METDNKDKAEGAKGAKGVASLIFGSMLLFIGLIDTMFAFKTGISGGTFNYIIILSGALLLITGLVRSR